MLPQRDSATHVTRVEGAGQLRRRVLPASLCRWTLRPLTSDTGSLGGMGEYQDLVDAGGLEAVLRAACRDCDVEMRGAAGALGGFVATMSKREREVYVIPLRSERLFHRHKLRATYLSSLSTTELAEVTGAVATWLSGATARSWPSRGRCRGSRGRTDRDTGPPGLVPSFTPWDVLTRVCG